MNRELDILVAKAKGLDVVGKANVTGYSTVDLASVGNNLEYVYVKHCVCNDEWAFPSGIRAFGHDEVCFGVVPFWSSDLNTAFELVDEIKLDDNVSFFDLVFHRYCELWSCTIRYKDDDFTISESKTPQEAICKAYIEWCEVK